MDVDVDIPICVCFFCLPSLLFSVPFCHQLADRLVRTLSRGFGDLHLLGMRWVFCFLTVYLLHRRESISECADTSGGYWGNEPADLRLLLQSGHASSTCPPWFQTLMHTVGATA